MKRILTAAVLLFGPLVVPFAMAADAPQRYVESSRFSFVPPDGWNARPALPGLVNKAHIAPIHEDFVANIVAIETTFSRSLDDYMRGNIVSMKRRFKGIEIVPMDDLKTADGMTMKRFFVESEQHGNKLRHVFYFAGDGEHKIAITCTTNRVDASLDRVFADSMRTFRFERK